MICNELDHHIVINYSANFSCLYCGCIFVRSNRRFGIFYECPISIVDKNLKRKFADFWWIEKAKLVATQQIVRKILISKILPNGEYLRLPVNGKFNYNYFAKNIGEILKDCE